MEVTGSTDTLAVNFCKTAKTSIDQFLWPKFLTICKGGAVAGFDARVIFSSNSNYSNFQFPIH